MASVQYINDVEHDTEIRKRINLRHADRNSTGWRLFKVLFRCSVRAKFLLTMQDAERYGVPTTGDDEYDAELANSTRIIYLPVSTLAELYAEGASIDFVRAEDIPRAYEIIMLHFDWWQQKFANTLYIRPDHLARVQLDLEKLDRLHEKLYPMVMNHHSKLQRPRLPGKESVSPRKLTDKKLTLDDLDNSTDTIQETIPHRGMSEIFGIDVLKRVRQWEK